MYSPFYRLVDFEHTKEKSSLEKTVITCEATQNIRYILFLEKASEDYSLFKKRAIVTNYRWYYSNISITVHDDINPVRSHRQSPNHPGQGMAGNTPQQTFSMGR